ncbi:chalcone isomerase family protein [Herbaspirillum lusitanum]|uniref:Chalcone isomerase family protein n=1 Tax=Herbaspirillum lusitanum TaxID=213312 RepID=A0ABW9AC75_9BURK
MQPQRRWLIHCATLLVLSVMLCIATLPGARADDDKLAATAAAAAPPHIAQALPHAFASGSGGFRWFGMRIYDARLWLDQPLPANSANAFDALLKSSAPFALDLRYARKLSGKRIAEASADQIEKLGLGNPGQRQQWLDQMRALFPDVQEGSHLSGIFTPNKGVSFFMDGKAIGQIEDPQFGKAFFAIWLAPETSAPELRQALLKKSAGE